jgi:hypothetical protein
MLCFAVWGGWGWGFGVLFGLVWIGLGWVGWFGLGWVGKWFRLVALEFNLRSWALEFGSLSMGATCLKVPNSKPKCQAQKPLPVNPQPSTALFRAQTQAQPQAQTQIKAAPAAQPAAAHRPARRPAPCPNPKPEPQPRPRRPPTAPACPPPRPPRGAACSLAGRTACRRRGRGWRGRRPCRCTQSRRGPGLGFGFLDF